MIERKWQPNKGTRKHSSSLEKTSASSRNTSKKAAPTPIITAMRNFRKGYRSPQEQPPPLTRGNVRPSTAPNTAAPNTQPKGTPKSAPGMLTDDGRAPLSPPTTSTPNLAAASASLAFSVEAVKQAAISPVAPMDGAKNGVRVTVSSGGDVLSTVKPEYEHLLSRPSEFFKIENKTLTNTLRPATTPNMSLDYSGFRISKMQLMKTMKAHREDVYQVRQSIVARREEDVRLNVLKKNNRRDEMKQARDRVERQVLMLQLVKISTVQKKFAAALAVGRLKMVRKKKRDNAANVIMRNWKVHFSMRMLKLVLAFKDLGLPFTLKVRIRRKHKFVETIKAFLDKIKAEAGPQIIKTFMHNVRKAQNYVRMFLACRKSRRELCNRYWVKIETKIRGEMHAKMREKMSQSQRLLAEIPDMMEVQYKFKAMRGKVRRQMQKVKEVEGVRKERWGAGVDGRSEVEKEEKKAERFVEASVREELVIKYVRSMRVAYLEETSTFAGGTVNNVIEDTNVAKILFKGGKAEMANLKVFAEEMMTVKQLERPKFCLFTGCYGGMTWRGVVEEAVRADTAAKSKGEKKVVFRSVKMLDEMIEKKATMRFEKMRRESIKHLEESGIVKAGTVEAGTVEAGTVKSGGAGGGSTRKVRIKEP